MEAIQTKPLQTARSGLRAKDLITTGIFSALMFIVIFFFAMLFSGAPVLALFITTADALAAGTIFLYLAVKVGKPGAVTIMSAIIGIIMFLAGHFWPCILFGLVFGLAADFLCGRGAYRKFFWNTAGFCVFILGLTLQGYTPMLLFTRAFVETRSRMGLEAAYIEKILEWTRGPLLIGAFSAALAAAVAGAFAGNLLLRRHFEKAGLL